MKLTGKWTPEERVAGANAALRLALQDEYGRARELPEILPGIAIALKILNDPANEIAEYVGILQAILDTQGRLPCLCAKCRAGMQHN
jgi:hypothetical protein